MAGAIVGFILAVIVLAIILKICNRFVFVNYFFILASALALVIVSFSAPYVNKDDGINVNVPIMLTQTALIACFIMFTWSGIVFDEEEYVETTATYDSFHDRVNVTSRMGTRSLFWSCLGTSLLTGFLLSFLPHFFAGSYDGSRFIGVIGIIMLVYWSVKFGIFLFRLIKYRRG